MHTWSSCISYRRFGYEEESSQNVRSEFIRDYDRLIFSSAFRRLQNKTQVFPLPGNVFVHNRLTHSLEVSSVGRSLGSIVGMALSKEESLSGNEEIIRFYKYDLSGVIASACLAHDLGNPAFGHSGEKAISNYFIHNSALNIQGIPLSGYFSEAEWADLTNFEGNANALRLLTQQFRGKLSGGQRLTYLTLATVIKYPCDSLSIDKSQVIYKKYGYFQSERKIFAEIAANFNLNRYAQYFRHPFVFLMEAADDICYRIIDMEDAHRIGILSTKEITDAFMPLILSLETKTSELDRMHATIQSIGDNNERVAYLRAKCINILVRKAAEVFLDNNQSILNGSFNNTLVDILTSDCHALNEIEDISIHKIYNHPSVIEVEIAGYNVMSDILDLFVQAVLTSNPTALQKKCLFLVPEQYAFYKDTDSPYLKVMGILDFVSGMTDGYATELYRKMKGIEIPGHK
jgi:dGTPase